MKSAGKNPQSISAMQGSVGKNMISGAIDSFKKTMDQSFKKTMDQLQSGIEHCQSDIKNNQENIKVAELNIAELEDHVIRATNLKANIGKMLGVTNGPTP